MHIRSLRFKLALLYSFIFGTIQAALCVAIVVARKHDLLRGVELSLLDRAELVSDSLDTPPLAVVPPALLNSPGFAGVYVQIAQSNGTITQRSPALQDQTLPPIPHDEQQARQAHILSGSVAEAIAGSGTRLLVHGFSHALPDGRFVEVQLAASLAAVDASLADLRQIVLIAFLSALALSAAASWFAAGRALAPIGSIARQAREIAATDLQRRLHVPPGKDEVRNMVRVLNEMLQRLEHTFLAQGRFIADVSHELNTPLTELIAEASMLARNDASPQEHQRFVRNAQHQLQRVAELIESLLTLARTESGVSPPTLRPVSINELVSETVVRHTASAARCQVKLVTQLAMPDADGSNPTVIGDTALLEVGISNLIRNAIRFSPPQQEVRVSVHPAAETVEIVVRDHGPGVPRAHLKNIFDRFYRVPETQGARLNCGLGLAIARVMVEAHGGSIRAANCADGGCEFTIQLAMAGVDGTTSAANELASDSMTSSEQES